MVTGDRERLAVSMSAFVARCTTCGAITAGDPVVFEESGWVRMDGKDFCSECRRKEVDRRESDQIQGNSEEPKNKKNPEEPEKP